MGAVWLNDKGIGDGHRPFIIAEVAQAHDGSLNFAHAYIDAAAEAGADAVKFQTHIADAETTPNEPWRIRFSRQDRSRYDYWKRMEFSAEAWRGLADHAAERKLVFLSSPFSTEAVELLDSLGTPAWKVASGEVSNLPLLVQMARTGKPVMLSSGMSSWEELDAAVEVVRANGAPLVLFQCTTAYPCPPERTGLNVLGELRNRYGCPVGLSDHSGRIYSGLAAVTLGAAVLEVHVTFHRKMFGPDVPASLTFEDLADLVEGSRFIATALAHPVDKAHEARGAARLREIFTKSVVATADMRAGRLIGVSDVACKKPGAGIPPSELDRVVGRVLKSDVRKDEPIRWSDLAD